MQTSPKLCSWCLLPWLCVLCMTGQGCGQGIAADKRPEWGIGDSWNIGIVLFSRDWLLDFSDQRSEEGKGTGHVLARYGMKVAVTGERVAGGADCWQLDFTPDEKAPDGVRKQRYRILVSKQGGAIKEFSRLSGEDLGNPELKEIDGITVLQNPPYGFPMDIIPWETAGSPNAAEGSSAARYRATRSRATEGHFVISVLEVEQGRVAVLTVRQKWATDAGWWDEYERSTLGHVEVQARLLSK